MVITHLVHVHEYKSHKICPRAKCEFCEVLSRNTSNSSRNGCPQDAGLPLERAAAVPD